MVQGIDSFRYDSGLRAMAEKTIKGHRGSIHHGKRIDCECGWNSSTYWGRGATGQCSYEFYDHKLNCLVAQAREKEDARLLADANSRYSAVQLAEMQRA